MVNYANIITWLRIAMTFTALGFLYYESFWLRFTAFWLIIVAIILDVVDGIVARRYNQAGEAGAMFDIAADRVIEISIWIVLADLNIVSVIVPIIFLFRGSITDLVRALNLKQGKKPFSERSGALAWLNNLLVSSRWSRAPYGVSKAVIFGYLVLLHAFRESTIYLPFNLLEKIGLVLVVYIVIFNVVRGVPVIYEGRKELFS